MGIIVAMVVALTGFVLAMGAMMGTMYLMGIIYITPLTRARESSTLASFKNGVKPMTATNLPKLSTRAQKALDVLADGGKFVCRLERNSYTGREQFAYRLLKEGRVVRGIGLAAFYEIKDTFLTICDHNTSVSTYYQLRREA